MMEKPREDVVVPAMEIEDSDDDDDCDDDFADWHLD
jgi:hypothetical protein